MNKLFRLLAIALLLLAAASAGCQKSGDDDDNQNNDDDNTPFQAKQITFTPAGSAQAGDIWLEMENADPAQNAFTLRLMGNGLTDVYGVAGRLTFDRAIGALNSAAPMVALGSGGATVATEAAANDAGGVFGFSRQGLVAGVAFAEPVVIGTLEFNALKAGKTDIAFTENKSRVMNPDLEVVEVAHWLGGTLTVE